VNVTKSVWARSVSVIFMLLCAAQASAQGLYNEGQQYFRLKTPMPVSTGAKIEVLEFFSYACPHCGTLEPHMEKWRATMPKNTQFLGVPAVFHDQWVPYARAYYASVDLKISAKSHSALFKALYEQKKNFTSLDEMATWYSQFGVSAKQFTDAFTAKGMEDRLKRVIDITPKYEVDGTPTIIVDGKYKCDGVSAGGYDKMPALINFLISKAAAERAAPRKAA
jgi:protein dithiol oxidoreductase (disulfide-forming)